MMGLKSIDMQVAILRSQDASKMQEQLTRQGQQFQETLTQHQLTEEMVKRQKTNRFENVTKREVDANHEQSNEHNEHQNNEKNKRDQQQKQEQRVEHPYLGRQIDWSG